MDPSAITQHLQLSKECVDEGRIELGLDGKVPKILPGKTGTFDGVLLRHQHRTGRPFGQVGRRERIVIRIGPFLNLEPQARSIPKKASGIADRGDSEDALPKKSAIGRVTSGSRD
jgi:hypothetical protein